MALLAPPPRCFYGFPVLRQCGPPQLVSKFCAARMLKSAGFPFVNSSTARPVDNSCSFWRQQPLCRGNYSRYPCTSSWQNSRQRIVVRVLREGNRICELGSAHGHGWPSKNHGRRIDAFIALFPPALHRSSDPTPRPTSPGMLWAGRRVAGGSAIQKISGQFCMRNKLDRT